MNQFFLKPLLPNSETDEQSDYERLLQLCESYGLNEEETQQLMDEFKKGGYDKVNSMKNSLNESMMSDQYEENEKESSEVRISEKEEPRTYENNFYEQEQQNSANPTKSTDRYYGYEEEEHIEENYASENKKYSSYQEDEISYNEMTFNHEHENQERISHDVDMRISQAKKYVPDFNKNLKTNGSKHSLNDKGSQNNQIFPSQKNSTHELSHNQSKESVHSQNSYHSIENQQLNPVYVKQLIENFELLEKETDDLKEKNNFLLKEQNSTKVENEMLKKEIELVKKERDELKIKNNFFETENHQLKSALESEKSKSETFKSIKERDSEIIQGLKDSILQFTAILKEKDAQSNDLQNKLIQMYEKNEKLNQQIYGSGQLEPNGATLGKIIEKLGSKKNLVSQYDEREEKSSIPNQFKKEQWQNMEKENRKESEMMKKEKDKSQVRQELSEMILNGMNNQHSQEMLGNQSKQLIREASTSKIAQSQNEQQNMEKNPMIGQRRPPKEIKENVFVGVEVETGENLRGVSSKKTINEEESKRRGSSRVDIKKYKGMIEELRNSYSNVPGNMMR